VIESLNPAAERQFGYRADDLVGTNVSVLMPEPYQSEHDAYLARYLETGERHIIGIGREVLGRTKDGRTLRLHLSVGEMMIAGQRKFTGILQDISERARIEEELRQIEVRTRILEEHTRMS
jgi:two-component system sensor kinase FixL